MEVDGVEDAAARTDPVATESNGTPFVGIAMVLVLVISAASGVVWWQRRSSSGQK